MTSTGFEGIQTAKVNGTTLAYREQGEGEPVVFVHGALSDVRIWQAQREALAQKYRAISYSLRYHCPNDPAPPDAEHSIVEHVDDLQGLVQALGAAPTHLVGNSSGGFMCLYLATRAPELVRSLVLLEPFLLPLLVSVPPKPKELLRLAFRHPRTAAAIVSFGVRGLAPTQAAFGRGDLEGGMQRFTRAVLGPDGMDGMPEDRQAQARDNLDAFAAQLTSQTFFPPLDAEKVRRLAMPTLLISGEQSPAIMHRFTEHLQALLPQAERVDIPGASHDAHVDNAPAVTEALLKFLGRHRPGA